MGYSRAGSNPARSVSVLVNQDVPRGNLPSIKFPNSLLFTATQKNQIWDDGRVVTVFLSLTGPQHAFVVKIKTIVEMPGIEPGTFHMQSERSTTELHPQLYKHSLTNPKVQRPYKNPDSVLSSAETHFLPAEALCIENQ